MIVLAAMQQEVTILQRLWKHQEPSRAPLEVHITGIGKDKAIAKTRRVLEVAGRPEAVICCGFAAGLKDELISGDLVIAKKLYSQGDDVPIEPDPTLLDLAKDVLENSRWARSFVEDTITVPEVVSSSAEKLQLGATTSAWAANVEDYWVGRTAIDAGVPFISVRTVLDPSGQDLPSFVAHIEDASVPKQVISVMVGLAMKPTDLSRVWNLYQQMKVAQHNLGTFGASFLSNAATKNVDLAHR